MKTSEIRKILTSILYKGQIKYWDVVAIDQFEIRNVIKFPAAFVINTQKHDIRTRGHWVCLILLDRRRAMYFDSLGRTVPPEINWLQPVNLNKRQIQSKRSSVCAEYCIFLLYHASRGINLKTLVNKFTKNCSKNDKIVVSFLNRIKKCQ